MCNIILKAITVNLRLRRIRDLIYCHFLSNQLWITADIFTHSEGQSQVTNKCMFWPLERWRSSMWWGLQNIWHLNLAWPLWITSQDAIPTLQTAHNTTLNVKISTTNHKVKMFNSYLCAFMYISTEGVLFYHKRQQRTSSSSSHTTSMANIDWLDYIIIQWMLHLHMTQVLGYILRTRVKSYPCYMWNLHLSNFGIPDKLFLSD